jgi:hypothetical protein
VTAGTAALVVCVVWAASGFKTEAADKTPEKTEEGLFAGSAVSNVESVDTEASDELCPP